MIAARSTSAALGGQRHERLEPVDEIERHGRRVRLRLDRHRPVLAPLPFQQRLRLFAAVVRARRDAAQVRQLVGRADAEHLAQIEGEQNGLTRVLADQPLRSPRAAHAAILDRSRRRSDADVPISRGPSPRRAGSSGPASAQARAAGRLEAWPLPPATPP